MRKVLNKPVDTPVFQQQAKELHHRLSQLTLEQLQKGWHCSEKVAKKSYQYLESMDFQTDLTPALLAYEGLVFQYLDVDSLSEREIHYLESHLRILSGMYGILRPMDGVQPYRLDFDSKFDFNLYKFWDDRIYKQLDDSLVINLASKEYEKCIRDHLKENDHMITCLFVENEQMKQKATYAKMARGLMIRYMAKNQVEDPEKIKDFHELDYQYMESLSSEKQFVFIRKE